MPGYYDPSKGPWCFGDGAKKHRRGKSPSTIALSDPREFFVLYDWMIRLGMKPKENEMVAYTFWVKERLELLVPSVCTFCRPWRAEGNPQLSLFEDVPGVEFAVETRTVKYLSVISSSSGISVDSARVCCDRDDCKGRLKGLSPSPEKVWFLSIAFREIARSDIHGIDYKSVVRVVQAVYGITGRLTNKWAHEILVHGCP